VCGPFDGPEWNSTDSTTPCGTLLGQMNAEVGPHNFYNLDDFCPREEMMDYLEWVEGKPPCAVRRVSKLRKGCIRACAMYA